MSIFNKAAGALNGMITESTLGVVNKALFDNNLGFRGVAGPQEIVALATPDQDELKKKRDKEAAAQGL